MKSGPWHFGRQWIAHEIEDRCPCPQADCGLVIQGVPDCDQHGATRARTMRQAHPEAACPGRHDLVTVDDSQRAMVTGACTCGQQYGTAPRAGVRWIIDEHLEHRREQEQAAVAAAELAAAARERREAGE